MEGIKFIAFVIFLIGISSAFAQTEAPTESRCPVLTYQDCTNTHALDYECGRRTVCADEFPDRPFCCECPQGLEPAKICWVHEDVPVEEEPCIIGGKTKQSGESFEAEDGCNTCTCYNGDISCTEKKCEETKSDDKFLIGFAISGWAFFATLQAILIITVVRRRLTKSKRNEQNSVEDTQAQTINQQVYTTLQHEQDEKTKYEVLRLGRGNEQNSVEDTQAQTINQQVYTTLQHERDENDDKTKYEVLRLGRGNEQNSVEDTQAQTINQQVYTTLQHEQDEIDDKTKYEVLRLGRENSTGGQAD